VSLVRAMVTINFSAPGKGAHEVWMVLLVVALGLAVAAVLQRTLAALVVRRADRRWPPEGSLVDVSGVRLHVIDRRPIRGSAEKPPVVLLHGSNGFVQDWTMSILDRLVEDEGHRTIAFDRAGSGHSGRPRVQLDAAVHLRLIRAALRELRIERPVVVGHSFSGAVVLRWAVEDPEELAGVVHVAGVAFGAEPPSRLPIGARALVALYSWTFPLLLPYARRFTLRTLVPAFAPKPVSPEYLRAAQDLWTRPKQFRVAIEDQMFTSRGLSELAPRYGAIKVPLAIVASDGDRHVPRAANADRLAAAVPGARLIDASPFGHDIPHVNPEPVLEAIRWVVQQANRVSIDRP